MFRYFCAGVLAMLTQRQIEHYQEDAVVVVPGVLDELTRKTMKGILAEWVEGSR